MKADGLLTLYIGAALVTCLVVGAVSVALLILLQLVSGGDGSSTIAAIRVFALPFLTIVVAYVFFYAIPAVAGLERTRHANWISVITTSLFPALVVLLVANDHRAIAAILILVFGVLLTSTFWASLGRLRGSPQVLQWIAAHGHALAFIFFCVSSVPLLVSTLFIKVSVATETELGGVPLGWPLPFVRQDLSALDPPLPYSFRLTTPQEYPVGVIPGALLLNILLVATPLWVLYLSLANRLNRFLTRRA